MTIPDQEQTDKVYRGAFFGWFETGLEGMVWALQSEYDNSLKGVVVLEESDYVEIRGEDGTTLFEGKVRPDYMTGKTPDKSPSGRNQSRTRGYSIRWTQDGFEPDGWGRFHPG